MPEPFRNWRVLPVLAILAIVAYLPLFRQPLVEDDYPNISMARDLGGRVVTNAIFGVRSTGFLLLDAIHSRFGVQAAPYYTLMILLHVFNTWLVYALGAWPAIGYRASAWAAAFFAVHEGHQEAIMWISANWELLQFLFGLGAFVCWLGFLYRGGMARLGLSLAAFAAAICSKESAVVMLPLLALPLVFDRAVRHKATFLAAFAIPAALAVLRVVNSRSYSFRFRDGSFSLHAPFWLTWPVSFARLFWFWGLLAVAVVLIVRPERFRSVLGIGLLWAAAGLAPYSFLTYSTRIPSRQTYLASAGVAVIVGCAFAAWPKRAHHRSIVAAAAVLLVLYNVTYLWTRKRAQFLARAAPTEQLIDLARRTNGPIYVRCFPRPPIIADAAVELTTGRSDLIWDAAQSGRAAANFCYQ